MYVALLCHDGTTVEYDHAVTVTYDAGERLITVEAGGGPEVFSADDYSMQSTGHDMVKVATRAVEAARVCPDHIGCDCPVPERHPRLEPHHRQEIVSMPGDMMRPTRPGETRATGPIPGDHDYVRGTPELGCTCDGFGADHAYTCNLMRGV